MSCLPLAFASSSHLRSPLLSGRDETGGGREKNVIKLGQDGNKDDGYSKGPCTLTSSRDSIAPVCLVECADVAAELFIQRSPGQTGGEGGSGVMVRKEGERVHLGPLHITCMTDA